jgi:hypothetical protein
MEKNIQMNPTRRDLSVLESAVALLAATLHQPMEWLRKYYSSVCEREIDAHQTRLLIEAQVAFVLTATLWGAPLLVHAGLFGWFLYAVVRCKLALDD